jgi:hypothetical protein
MDSAYSHRSSKGVLLGFYYSSAWVGIDGYSDNTVEQIGTEQDWIWGRAIYYSWFEMYPNRPYRILARVSPDDKMVAEAMKEVDRRRTFI